MAVDRNTIKAIVQEVLSEQAQEVDSLVIAETLDDVNSLPAFQGSEIVLVPLKALKGEKGEKGEAGERGEQGPPGEKGDPGDSRFTEELNEAKKNLENLITSKNEETKVLVTALQERINTLVGANASEAIESFNEVIKFLGGVKDNDTLNALLVKINERLNTLETAVNTIDTAITELKNKKVIAEEVTTTENGSTRELTLQAGKVYMLSENVDKLRIKAIAPPENTKEVAEVMLYFHTGQNGDNGVVVRSGDAPTISFEGVALPKDMKIENNMFYEISFKYNPIARKYTALVASWAIS